MAGSKNQLQQQETERRHVERFLELLSLKAVIEPGDQPDFVLGIDQRRVGLEHSELYDQGLQENRAHVKRFEKTLVEEMRTRGVAADFDVVIYFAASGPRWRTQPAQVSGAPERAFGKHCRRFARTRADADPCLRLTTTAAARAVLRAPLRPRTPRPFWPLRATCATSSPSGRLRR